MFGGYNMSQGTYINELWQLNKSTERAFTWSKVTTENIEAPSPRCLHSGWTYLGKLWIFGGFGPSLDGYLSDNGDFLQLFTLNKGYNNQLLSFNPSSKEWVSLKSSGSIPSPRESHASTTIGDKVWLYGGYDISIVFDELYKLNMSSLVWTQVQTGKTKPQGRYSCSLSAITHHRLLLHGGSGVDHEPLRDTWILDLSSKTWKQCKPGDYPRCSHTESTGINSNSIIIGGGHTGSTGINSNSIIIGGSICPVDSCDDDHQTTFCIMLEPKSLQQLAMQTIYKHRNLLSCESLPMKLIKLLGMSSNE